MTIPQQPHPFAIGAVVRVKNGTPSDYHDIPLGGWVGTVREVSGSSGSATYCIEFTPQTLAQITPVYQKRCRRDGFSETEMWLGEESLDAYTGGPIIIEQPTRLESRQLNWADEDDRIRDRLGLTSDDPIRGQGGHNTVVFEEHFLMVTESKTQAVIGFMFPVIADWIQYHGRIEFGLSSGKVIAKVTDGTGVLFEDGDAKDLAGALNVLEQAISRLRQSQSVK